MIFLGKNACNRIIFITFAEKCISSTRRFAENPSEFSLLREDLKAFQFDYNLLREDWRFSVIWTLRNYISCVLQHATFEIGGRAWNREKRNLFQGAEGMCISENWSNVSWRKVDIEQPWRTCLVCHECYIWQGAKSKDFSGKHVCEMFCSNEIPDC